MRLGKTYEILQQELPFLKLEAIQESSNLRISNFYNIRQSLERISTISALKNQANSLLGKIPHVTNGQIIIWNITNYNQFVNELSLFLTKAQALREALSDSVVKPEPGTVYLKLPQFTNLHTLIKEAENLEISFSQIFGALNSNVTIELKGFDTGTPWLVFFVGSAAVTFFSGTLIAAMRIAQEGMKTKMIFNQYEASNNDSDRKKKIKEAIDLIIDNVITKEAEALVEKYALNPNQLDGDEAIRVAHALQNLSKLFANGGDVQIPQITQDLIEEEKLPADNESYNFEEVSEKLEASTKELLNLPIL